jgi:hypothetical protein
MCCLKWICSSIEIHWLLLIVFESSEFENANTYIFFSNFFLFLFILLLLFFKMDLIPIELLHEIFIKLHIKDKLECMLVCRFWYDMLDRRSLLHALNIPERLLPKLKKNDRASTISSKPSGKYNDSISFCLFRYKNILQHVSQFAASYNMCVARE